MVPQYRVAMVGECMIEIAMKNLSTAQVGFAGDTLNTAVYFSRTKSLSHCAYYITALGEDEFSEAMMEQWHNEGIVSEGVRKMANKLPGLYLIRNKSDGEKQFFYYRSQSAAREMFDGEVGDVLCDFLLSFDVLYFSGITLGILSPSSRLKFLRLLQTFFEKKKLIAFDSNYRPLLWRDTAEARTIMEEVLPFISIALPSLGDEQLLFGDTMPQTVIQRLRSYGISEIVLKMGGEGYYLWNPGEGETYHEVQKIQQIIDTSGAGDAFNGVYLAKRLGGDEPVKAAKSAALISALVLGHRGAILPKEAMPNLSEMR